MSFLTLQEAADQLGVHYMTAYRYVRTGRLDASKSGALWQVHVDDLKAFTEAKDPADQTAALTSLDDAWLRLYKRLVAGDEAGSWYIVEECLSSGMTPHDIHDRLLGPAMTEVGERWSCGNLDVAGEHLATATVIRLIGRLGPRFSRPGRPRGTVVIGMVAGDSHALPSAMLADVLRLHGFQVIDLGADTPPESFVAAARRANELIAIGMCSIGGQEPTSLPDTVATLHAEGFGEHIFVGGPAVIPANLERFTPTPVVTNTAHDAVAFIEASGEAAAVAS